MKRISISLLGAAMALACAALAPASAHAAQVRFSGPHPIPEAVDGDFCYIEVPHVHIYEPESPKVLYRVHDDQYHFIGDPVAHGYDGPKHSYYGHHPVVVDASVHIDVHAPVTEYCYLDGPHFHHYAPPPDVTFELKGGAYWYIGKYPRPYHRHRKRYARINTVYEPIVYERPVIEVEAPAGYLGPVVEVHAHAPDVEVHAPDVEVRAPAVRAGVDVDVHIPIPTVEVGIGLPGVVVVDGHHHGHRHHRHRKHKKFKKHKKHKHHRHHRKHRRWR